MSSVARAVHDNHVAGHVVSTLVRSIGGKKGRGPLPVEVFGQHLTDCALKYPKESTYGAASCCVFKYTYV